MDCQKRIDYLMTQNDWVSLERYLVSDHNFRGYIPEPFGGRYCREMDMKVVGRADINRICWSTFIENCNQPLRELPPLQRLAAFKVIEKLKNLYDEAEVELTNASYMASIATRVYDLAEKIPDGLDPIGRLEDCAL